MKVPRQKSVIKAFDALVIAGLVMVPFFAWYGLRVAQVGFLPLLAAPFLWRHLNFELRDLFLLALIAFYGTLVSLNYALYPTIGGEAPPRSDKVTLHLGMILLAGLALIRCRESVDLAGIWRVVAPAVLTASLVLLAWQHLTTPPPGHCRVGLLTKDVMYPPAYLGVFTIATFHGWGRLARPERWLRYCLLAAAATTMVAFLGSRGGLLALAVAAGGLAVLLGWGQPLAARLRIAAKVGAAGLAGILIGLMIDAASGCGYSDRVLAIIATFQEREQAGEITETVWQERLATNPRVDGPTRPSDGGNPSAPSPPQTRTDTGAEPTRGDSLIASVYIRPLIWRAGIAAVGEAPVLGHGLANESTLTPAGLPHFHQQYLTWLVGGGPALLISGLLLLFSPLATFGVRGDLDRAILALALTVPLALYLTIETFLSHTTNVLAYTLLLTLFHVMARPAPDNHRDQRP